MAIDIARWIGTCILALSLGLPYRVTDVRADDSTNSESTKKSESHYSLGFPSESHNPGAKERQRLRVDWDKTSMIVQVWSGEKEAFVWKEAEETDWKSQLSIRGTLKIVSDDGKTTRPIDWLQGARVVIARKSGNKLDWSKELDTRDAKWVNVVIEDNGAFQLRLEPHVISRLPGSVGEYQVGLTLAVKEGRRITWTNADPVLENSISTLRIAGPRSLNATQQIINAAPSYKDLLELENPALLVRAVNHLRSLGKDRAASELREYLKYARRSFRVERDPANIDTSDREAAFPIMKLLFDVPDQGRRMPYVPPFKVALIDDIPFVIGPVGFFTGPDPNPIRYLDWAETNCKLREQPLRPGNNPLAAVDQMLAQSLGKEELRSQAWNCIRHLVDQPLKNIRFANDGDWEELKKAASAKKIRWSEIDQKYIVE